MLEAKNAADAFVAGEEALRQGKFEDACLNYLSVVRAVPQHWRSRFRIADTLLNLKAPQYSLEIYKAIALHAIKAGHPLWGLVAIKMAAAMDRSQHDLVHVIADLYSRDSKRVDENKASAPRRKLTKNDSVGDVSFLKGEKLVEEAGRDACDLENVEPYPEKLPSIPLFSYLDEESFGDVLERLQLRRFVKGQKIIEEGQAGASFFILAEGDVSVTRNMKGRDVTLARLGAGAVFGEMALISKAPRTATVVANADCDLLELSRADLEDSAHKLKSVTTALHEFTHQRFLANLTATSPIFKPIPRSLRAEIVKKFRALPVEPGQKLISEGEEGHGLYMVLKGQIEVTKEDSGERVVLATLKEGDVFGEISLLQSSPTTASCHARTKGEVLFLGRQDFHSTMARHPELKDELSKLTADRIKKTQELMNPEDDDFILIEDDDLIML